MLRSRCFRGVSLAFGWSALCIVLVAFVGCGAIPGFGRSCEAITADIFSNLSGAGITPSQATICRSLELTLEAFDAGCTVPGGGDRALVVAQIEAECGG